jgi:hypothetical protein
MDQEVEIEAVAKTFIENKQKEVEGPFNDTVSALERLHDMPHTIISYKIVNRTIVVTDEEGKPVLDEKGNEVLTWRWFIQWTEEWITIKITVSAWSWIGAFWFWSFIAIFLIMHYTKHLLKFKDAFL